MESKHYEILLHRYAKNPILTAGDWPYPVHTVFNPAATLLRDGTTLLLCRCEDRRGISHLCAARSSNGVDNWVIDPEPTFSPDPLNFPEELWGVEDPRITFMPELDEYLIAYTAYGKTGPGVAIATTKDFISFEPVDIVALPDNRVPCLFPEKIGGYYYRLERPYSMGSANERGHIWTSRSPDLVHWGHHRFLMKGFTNWNWEKIGPTAPVKTEKGWLEIIHGVSSSCSIVSYSLGAILLDLENPEKIIGRMESYLLTAEEDYEFRGRCPGCVFATGAIADMKTRRLRVYYGAADTCIGLAEGNLDEIIDACLKGL